MMAQHTPGPWKVWEQTDLDVSAPSAHVALVSDIYVVGSGELAAPDADARVIALAPKMLDYIRSCASNCAEANELLKRAEGRA